MQLKSVVLPAPFGPINPTIERSATSNETSEFAARPPKNLLTCLISRMAMVLGGALPASPEAAKESENSFRHEQNDDDHEDSVDEDVRVREVLFEERADARLLADHASLDQRIGND